MCKLRHAKEEEAPRDDARKRQRFGSRRFFLWSRVDSRLQRNKLHLRCVIPSRVVDVLQHSFIVEHLITNDKFDVHLSLNVTTELKEHVANEGSLLETVQSLVTEKTWLAASGNSRSLGS
ncbi:hypothetical protein PsorP6_008620 [Peronosclerospora sorghi]|uniref:Uncharacterized protein n=1 Tax=Peronosclerospora sorghi TaxID=230839 RepID=A0ACC0WAE9_9STRA|nr:hypothetical protein PsorP6_008620 [Peronosclerospora sorghi]